jgi:hypothetical protein
MSPEIPLKTLAIMALSGGIDATTATIPAARLSRQKIRIDCFIVQPSLARHPDCLHNSSYQLDGL